MTPNKVGIYRFCPGANCKLVQNLPKEIAQPTSLFANIIIKQIGPTIQGIMKKNSLMNPSPSEAVLEERSHSYFLAYLLVPFSFFDC